MRIPELEPLEEGALLARRLAPEQCRVDPSTGERCAWNHGFWPILRLLGMNATPADQAALYQSALRALAAGSRRARILISGSADFGMLHQVLTAFGRCNLAPEVTVVDICETPLALNRWYAKRFGLMVSTVCSDILAYDTDQPFDAVCTHSFLAQFSAQDRERLIGVWHGLLRPGGIAVTVNRVRPQAEAGRVSFSRDQAEALRDAVVARLASLPVAIGLDPVGLVREAEAYAQRQRPHPVRSVEEIRALFERGGFAIERLSCAPVDAGEPQTLRGPTVSAGADYASIIARRR